MQTTVALRGRQLLTLLDLAHVNSFGSSIGDDAPIQDNAGVSAVADDANPAGPFAVADDAPADVLAVADDAVREGMFTMADDAPLNSYSLADDAVGLMNLASASVASDAVEFGLRTVADDAIAGEGPFAGMMAASVADDAIDAL